MAISNVMYAALGSSQRQILHLCLTFSTNLSIMVCPLQIRVITDLFWKTDVKGETKTEWGICNILVQLVS